jgi:hypothetical protein
MLFMNTVDLSFSCFARRDCVARSKTIESFGILMSKIPSLYKQLFWILGEMGGPIGKDSKGYGV